MKVKEGAGGKQGAAERKEGQLRTSEALEATAVQRGTV